MSIAATRMYRSLADFASESTDVSDILTLPWILHAHSWSVPFSFQDGTQGSGRALPRNKDTPRARVPVTQMEVTMQTVYEQYPASQSRTSRPSEDWYIAMDGRMRHHHPGRSRDDVAEMGVENGVLT